MNKVKSSAISQRRGRANPVLLGTHSLVATFIIALTLLVLTGCARSFVVSATATRDFPETWSETLSKVETAREVSRLKRSPQLASAESQIAQRPLPPPNFTGELERVAVLELSNRVPKQVSVDEISYLSDQLRTVASYLPKSKYLVLTKESLEVLIDPSVNVEDCVGKCEVETGRLVGAHWILTGEVVRFGRSLRVSLKVHNTQSGQFLKGTFLKGNSVEELEAQLHRQALSLVKEVSPKWGRWLDRVTSKGLDKQLEYLRERTR